MVVNVKSLGYKYVKYFNGSEHVIYMTEIEYNDKKIVLFK